VFHDPIINKLIATTHDQIITEMTPVNKNQNTFTMGQPETVNNDLTSQEIVQHWIIEDFE
jgi:hypothetical protein